ncbi:Hpt domain-containing protein, partial [Marinobacter sp.]
IHSVVSALNEELAKLKDQLDLFVRSELRQNDELEELLPGLRQVANTLAVLGLGIPRKVITEQIELVEKLANQSDSVDDGTLMDIAGALLYVEASLAGLDGDRQSESDVTGDDTQTINLGSRELGEASSALLRESRNTLEQVKTAIVNFIASQWETGEIEHVPGLLHSIRGGLSLIPLDRVADMLASAERYITDVLLGGKQVPDWKQLDTLADAITSIEYYLERLAEGISDNESVLGVAEASLNSLGFPVGEEPTWKHPTADEVPVVDAEVPVESVEAESKSSDKELLDDEILGIFIEEAEEVLETINEFYPRLRQNHDDRDALTEVRRAFHTLKGSGRLVGATSIGELAWSVENLLNRVIDQTLRPTDDMFGLIDDVNSRIPSLINDFRDGQADGEVAELIERAEALSTTRKTDIDSVSEETGAVDEELPVIDGGSDGEAAHAGQQSIPEAEFGDDLIDDEILEIFIEEAGEVLDTIREYLPMLLRQHDDRTALSEVRRAFHTLKGSGRMVGALVVGELAWSVENMLNRVIDGSIFMNDDIAAMLDDATAALPELVDDFEKRQSPSRDTSSMEARANALANGEIPDTSTMPPSEPQSETVSGEAEPELTAAEEDAVVDPVLLDIFESETETHLQTLQDFLYAAGNKASVAYTDDLSRALHTLKGSAHTAGIAPIATVITPLERFVKEARARNKRADRDVISLIGDTCHFLTQGLGQIRENPQADLPGTETFLAKLEQVSNATLRGDGSRTDDPEENARPQLVQLFLNEGLDILLDADRILDEWAENPEATSALETLRRELHQLTEGAQDAGLGDVAELSGALKQVYERASNPDFVPDSPFFDSVRAGHEHLINMMDQVAAGLATEANADLIANLEILAPQTPADNGPDAFEQEFTGDLEEIDRSLEAEAEDAAEPSGEMPPLAETDEDMDQELAEIFLEEARDLIDSTADALQSWSDSTENLDLLRLLQRDLHTLKGGARLADIQPVGDLSHELENLFEGLTEQRLAVTGELSDLLFRSHDRLAGMVDALEQQEPPRPAPDLISEIHAYMDSATGSRPVTDVRQQDAEPEDDDEIPLAELEEDETEEPETTAEEPEEEHATDLSHLDPELIGIFLEEAYDLINSTGSALHTWSEDINNRDVAAELQRDVHTLKGGARMAGVDAIGDLTHVLEDLFEKVAEGQLDASNDMNDLLFACHDRLAQMVEQVATQKPCPPATELVAKVEAILSGKPQPSAELEEPAEEPETVDEAPAADEQP